MHGYSFFVYIVTNRWRSVFYVGVTNNLPERLVEHYMSRGDKTTFTGRYHVYNLVYKEHYRYIDKAIYREKEIKGWRRDKKIALIKTINPEMKFLNEEVCGVWPPKNTHHPRSRR